MKRWWRMAPSRSTSHSRIDHDGAYRCRLTAALRQKRPFHIAHYANCVSQTLAIFLDYLTHYFRPCIYR
jgi:hypothetical protein